MDYTPDIGGPIEANVAQDPEVRVKTKIKIGGDDSAAFVVLKIALFLIAVAVLGGLVVFAFKVVGTLVDAGTRAVNKAVEGRDHAASSARTVVVSDHCDPYEQVTFCQWPSLVGPHAYAATLLG